LGDHGTEGGVHVLCWQMAEGVMKKTRKGVGSATPEKTMLDADKTGTHKLGKRTGKTYALGHLI